MSVSKNPGLNPAMSVELGRRALHALLTLEDQIVLMVKGSFVLNLRLDSSLEHFVMASDE